MCGKTLLYLSIFRDPELEGVHPETYQIFVPVGNGVVLFGDRGVLQALVQGWGAP